MLTTDVSPTDDDGKTASNPAAVGGICDGSDELRLVVGSNPGPGAVFEYVWTQLRARPLLIVDGHCHYYAARDMRLGEVTQGQLSPALLTQLTADLSLDDLGSLPSQRNDCADHWSDRVVSTQDQSLRCRCDDCGTGTRSTEVINNAVAWIDRLARAGSPLSGVMSALAIKTQRHPDTAFPPPLHDWPLPAALRALDGLVYDPYSLRMQDRAGVFFAGADAQALRRLRLAALPEGHDDIGPYAVFVKDGDCDHRYYLMLRDELPASVETRLETFLAVAWKRPQIDSCIQFPQSQPVSPCPPED